MCMCVCACVRMCVCVCVHRACVCVFVDMGTQQYLLVTPTRTPTAHTAHTKAHPLVPYHRQAREAVQCWRAIAEHQRRRRVGVRRRLAARACSWAERGWRGWRRVVFAGKAMRGYERVLRGRSAVRRQLEVLCVGVCVCVYLHVYVCI